jgi:3-methyladenine DNA glycosylase AlkD
MKAARAPAKPSATTLASNAFVETHIRPAQDLGRLLAGEIDAPASFVAVLREGLASLADPAYLDGLRRVAPGIGPVLGVRGPLLSGVHRALVRELRRVRSARLLPVAQALAREALGELRWFACWLLKRVLPDDPERAWQVLRELAAAAEDWISVDTLAATMGPGILREPYRWAELEQLVYSPSRWERRLVGSTLATMPFVDRAAGRTPDVAARGLALVGLLIGDPEPDVQKALGWALRSLAIVDQLAVTAFCRSEGTRAASTGDGARAWVVRDCLMKLDAADAAHIRALLANVRRRRDASDTSTAAGIAVAFVGTGRRPAAFRDQVGLRRDVEPPPRRIWPG